MHSTNQQTNNTNRYGKRTPTKLRSASLEYDLLTTFITSHFFRELWKLQCSDKCSYLKSNKGVFYLHTTLPLVPLLVQCIRRTNSFSLKLRSLLRMMRANLSFLPSGKKTSLSTYASSLWTPHAFSLWTAFVNSFCSKICTKSPITWGAHYRMHTTVKANKRWAVEINSKRRVVYVLEVGRLAPDLKQSMCPSKAWFVGALKCLEAGNTPQTSRLAPHSTYL